MAYGQKHEEAGPFKAGHNARREKNLAQTTLSREALR
jgi:hypothetical protein